MKSEAPPSHCVVRFDDTAVTCVHPAGHTERVSWDDLQEVIVQTTDAGLSFTDKSWILTGSAPGSGCVILQGSEGGRALLERLQQLPEFNTDTFNAAMSSISDAQFVCWRRPA